MPMLVKEYIYQVYDSQNNYITSLNNVTSDFSYKQNINSGGAELEINIGNSFDDVGAQQVDEFWITENNEKIVDESGNHIVWSARFVFNNIPIAPGNRVKVFATYDDYPSGRQVFDGVITKFKTSYQNNNITLIVLSWGVQLDNFLLNADPTGFSIDQEVYDKEYTPTVNVTLGTGSPVAQSFNIPSAAVVGGFSVFVRANSGTFNRTVKGIVVETVTPIAILYWFLYSGTPASPGSLIESGSLQLTGTNVRQLTGQFSQSRSLNGNYFLVFKSGNAGSYYYTDPVLEATSTNPYASGSVYTGAETSSGIAWSAVAADDLAFIIQTTSGDTAFSFINQDPGIILQRIIDQLNAQGGLITYNSASVEQASTQVSYDYKVQTILEGVQKVIQLSPDGYYWYTDPATNLIHYHRTGNSADHTLVLGQHISELDIEYDLEQVVNAVYFSGGDDGSGSNIYIAQKDVASADLYGQWMRRISDNRVTDAETAAVIASSEIGVNNSPSFHTQVEVLASTYDIENFSLGDMVNLRGFNNLIDTILFQIASIERNPDSVVLTVGSLLPRQSSELDNVRRRLVQLESLNNPSSPS